MLVYFETGKLIHGNIIFHAPIFEHTSVWIYLFNLLCYAIESELFNRRVSCRSAFANFNLFQTNMLIECFQMSKYCFFILIIDIYPRFIHDLASMKNKTHFILMPNINLV